MSNLEYERESFKKDAYGKLFFVKRFGDCGTSKKHEIFVFA